MEDKRLGVLLNKFLDAALEQGEKAELERTLRESAAARTEFWEQARMHGMLHSAEKLRSGTSSALKSVRPDEGACLVDPPREIAAEKKKQRTISGRMFRGVGWRRWTAIAAALVAVAVLAWIGSRWMGAKPAANTFVASLRQSESAVWAGSFQPAQGDPLPCGPLQLDSGVAEIVFFNGVVVVVQGPAKFEVESIERIRLKSGNLSADVPHNATGFTVQTPNSMVIDLGTRFGVKVDEKGGVTEAHVFEGKVNIQPDEKIKSTPQRRSVEQDKAVLIDSNARSVTDAKFNSGQFPTPGRVIDLPLKDGGFEPSASVLTEGILTRPGQWGGDICSIVEAQKDIAPQSGKGMLRFLHPYGTDADYRRRPHLVSSDEWQTIDLRPYRKLLEHSTCSAELTGAFACVADQAELNKGFGIEIYAFTGNLEDAPQMWKRKYEDALSCGSKEIPMSQCVRKWQRLQASMPVPPNADLLIIHLYAKRLIGPGGSEEEFPGHYADSVELKLRVSPSSGTP